MKKPFYILLLLFVILIIGMPVIVYASNLTGAQYHGTITVSNNSTAANNIMVSMALTSPVLISQGWVNAEFNNVAIQNSSGADTAFMPGYNTNPWMIFVPSIGDNSSINYTIYTGNVTDGKLCYFPGAAGMVIANDITMRLYDTFQIKIEDCYIDTSAGANKRIIYKQSACQLIVSASESGKITFSITTGASVSATGLPSGEYDIEVTANQTDLMIYVDDVLKGSAAFTNDVPYNGFAWILFEGDTVKYVRSFKLYK
jgi:hypothetical protein